MLLKKYSDFGGGKKKKSDSEFLSYNLMLNSGKKIALCTTKKNKYSNSCVVGKKISEQKKNIVEWLVPNIKPQYYYILYNPTHFPGPLVC